MTTTSTGHPGGPDRRTAGPALLVLAWRRSWAWSLPSIDGATSHRDQGGRGDRLRIADHAGRWPACSRPPTRVA